MMDMLTMTGSVYFLAFCTTCPFGIHLKIEALLFVIEYSYLRKKGDFIRPTYLKPIAVRYSINLWQVTSMVQHYDNFCSSSNVPVKFNLLGACT